MGEPVKIAVILGGGSTNFRILSAGVPVEFVVVDLDDAEPGDLGVEITPEGPGYVTRGTAEIDGPGALALLEPPPASHRTMPPLLSWAEAAEIAGRYPTQILSPDDMAVCSECGARCELPYPGDEESRGFIGVCPTHGPRFFLVEEDEECGTCAEASETRLLPCDECGASDADGEALEPDQGAYSPELVEAFRVGARELCNSSLGDKIEVPADAEVRECDGDGVLVQCWLYVHDIERASLAGEDRA
jgi:hypothetical protein